MHLVAEVATIQIYLLVNGLARNQRTFFPRGLPFAMGGILSGISRASLNFLIYEFIYSTGLDLNKFFDSSNT
jgi:hypothetical protein